jgi:outer membrane receptor for monomeric catechols
MSDFSMDPAQAVRHAALAQAVEVVRYELGPPAFYDTEPPDYPHSASDLAELERRALVDEAATIERVLRIARRLAAYIESGVTDTTPDAVPTEWT